MVSVVTSARNGVSASSSDSPSTPAPSRTSSTLRIQRHQQPHPHIPHLSASRLLSVPSFRPRRKARQSSLDPAPSTSYGDPIIQKTPGSIRVLFQNVHGLTHSTTHEDYRYYHQCLQGLDVDIVGLSETNTCWSHHHLASDFRSSIRNYHRQSKTTFGTVSPEVDPCSQSETFQAGGNLTCVMGSLAARVNGSDITDPSGLGRWSVFSLEGTNSKKLSIITAYRVCSGSPKIVLFSENTSFSKNVATHLSTHVGCFSSISIRSLIHSKIRAIVLY